MRRQVGSCGHCNTASRQQIRGQLPNHALTRRRFAARLRAWPLAWPCRQARWVARGSACKVGPEDPFCGAVRKDLRCPCGWRGRPGQCAAFRPGACDFPGVCATRARLTAWSSRPGAAPGRYGGYRTRPVTGATGRGSSARRGLPPKGRDESCRTAYGEPPGPDPGRLRRVTLAFIFPRLAASVHVIHVLAVRPGAPKVRP